MGIKHERVPNWALVVAEQVSEAYGKPTPELRWLSPSKHWSSHGATCYEDNSDGTNGVYIRLAPGEWIVDQAQVLLHELAHYTLPIEEHHSVVFWERYFDIIRDFEFPINYSYLRSGGYKSTASWVAERRWKFHWEIKVQMRQIEQGVKDFRLEPKQFPLTDWNPAFPWRQLLRLGKAAN